MDQFTTFQISLELIWPKNFMRNCWASKVGIDLRLRCMEKRSHSLGRWADYALDRWSLGRKRRRRLSRFLIFLDRSVRNGWSAGSEVQRNESQHALWISWKSEEDTDNGGREAGSQVQSLHVEFIRRWWASKTSWLCDHLLIQSNFECTLGKVYIGNHRDNKENRWVIAFFQIWPRASSYPEPSAHCSE